MSLIDYDELRKEIAIKHNVLLGKDDPILVTVTLNDLVIGRYVENLNAANEEQQRLLAAALAEHVEQAKGAGSRVITDAANYVSDQVRQAATTALSEASVVIRQEFAAAHAASREALDGARTSNAARSTAVIAAAVAGMAAVVAIAALVIVLLK